MSYIKTKIVGASEVKAHARVSRWVFFDDVILAIITGGVLVLGIIADTSYNPIIFDRIKLFLFIGLILVALTVLDIIKEFFKVCSTEIALTDNRIIGKTGTISVDILDSQLESYDAIQIKISLVDRIIGTGKVIIFTHGHNKHIYRRIKKPLDFQKAVNNMIDERKRMDQKVVINRVTPVENITEKDTSNKNDNTDNIDTNNTENIVVQPTQVVVEEN